MTIRAQLTYTRSPSTSAPAARSRWLAAVVAVVAVAGPAARAAPRNCDKDPAQCPEGPPDPPSFWLSTSPVAASVNQGFHTSFTVNIQRTNFPDELTFHISGLPAGVTATLPSTSTADQITVTLNATNTAATVTGAHVTITAKPPIRSHRVPQSTSLDLTVKHVYFIDSGNAPESATDPVPLALSPCTRSIVLFNVVFPKGATGAAQIAATSLPPGYKASFSFTTAYAPSGGAGGNVPVIMALDGTSAPDIPGSQAVTLTVTRNGIASSRILPISFSPGAITSITPAVGLTPRGLKPGTTMTLHGQGFCAGSKVTFGNRMAIAPLTPVGSDGKTATVVVPPLATSGAVSFANDHGMSAAASLKIDSWRNTSGLSWENSDAFQNLVGGYNLADLDAVFGEDQTRTLFNLPDPLAAALILVLDKFFEDGQCFGMALAAEKLQGPQTTNQYPSWAGGSEPPGNDSWHLTGPGLGNGAKDSPALARYVHRLHVVQTGSETLGQWLSYNAKTASQLKQDIVAALHAGGALMSMNGDHVVAILDVRDPTQPGEAFLIDTYDPNVPFAADAGKTDENETSGATHATRLGQSTVTVNANNTIHFADDAGNAFDIAVSKVTLLPMSLYAKRPTMLSLAGLSGVVLSGFGFGTAVTQVTDEQGHTLLRADGSLNTDPATQIAELKPFPGMGGTGHAAQLFVASARRAYTYTLAGKGASYDAHAIGPGYAVQLDGIVSQAGVSDQLRVAPAQAAFEFRTTGAQKAFHGQLIVRAPDKHVRTAVVHGTSFSGQPIRMEFNAARDEVTYTHRGGAASVALELSSTRSAAKLVTAPVAVEHGDVVTFHPDWDRLGAAAGSVRVRKVGGAVKALPLR